MNAKKLLMGIFICFLIFGCGFKYKTYEDFRNADEDKRIEQITKILKESKLKSYNKFTLIYIDYILTTIDFYKILEMQFPDVNFKKFFRKAVLTLYYSYEPDNFKLAPEEWRKKTEVFLLNLLEFAYPYSYGKEKYREYLKEDISKGDSYVFWFYSSDSKDPEEEAKGDRWEWNRWFDATLAWRSDKFTFIDFKKLDSIEQALVLRRNAFINMVNNEKIDDDSVKYLDAIQEEWKYQSKYYLSKKSIKELSDDTTFKIVFDKIISKMVE